MSKQRDPKTPKGQPLIALAFDPDGKLLCKGSVKGDNAIYFDADPKALRRSRVFVLPAPEEKKDLERLNIQQLERRITFEPRLRFNENGGLVFEAIPDRILDFWWWQRCCVRGRVTNQINV
ncbi:MAG: hypothetical protein HRU12_07150, partial [Phaeodactylibacter sp.]|nr:hypothetical protein [Phaeodactylibacter sp.]